MELGGWGLRTRELFSIGFLGEPDCAPRRLGCVKKLAKWEGARGIRPEEVPHQAASQPSRELQRGSSAEETSLPLPPACNPLDLQVVRQL